MKGLVLSAALMFAAARICAQDTVSSDALISRAASFDGRVIAFSGEVIGDVMPRGDHAWVNISDGANAIGVWLPLSMLPRLSYLGSYRARGDVLLVQGVFHRACPDHGGDMDIHAFSVEAAAPGAPVGHPVRAGSMILAGVLLAAAGGAFVAWRARERHLARF